MQQNAENEAIIIKQGASLKPISPIQSMFDTIASKYDRLNGIISCNADKRWRSTAVKMLNINKDDIVLDIASGTGDMALNILSISPCKELYATDFSINMLSICKEKLHTFKEEKKIGTECELLIVDASSLPFKDNSFDKLTIAFGFRNFPDKPLALKEINRVLKKGGKACILELIPPENFFKRHFYNIYFKHILPIIGGFLSSKNAYRYLPDSVYSFPKMQEYRSMIHMAGFHPDKVLLKKLFLGAVSIAIMEK